MLKYRMDNFGVMWWRMEKNEGNICVRIVVSVTFPLLVLNINWFPNFFLVYFRFFFFFFAACAIDFSKFLTPSLTKPNGREGGGGTPILTGAGYSSYAPKLPVVVCLMTNHERTIIAFNSCANQKLRAN